MKRQMFVTVIALTVGLSGGLGGRTRAEDPPAAAARPVGLVSVLKHDDTVVSSDFSPDGKTLVTTTAGSEIRLWDVATGKELGRAKIPRLGRVVFLPSGRMVIVSDRFAVHLLTVPELTLEKTVTLEGKDALRPRWMLFSPDGKTEAVRFRSSIFVWDLSSGKIRHRIELGHGRFPVATESPMAYSPDGKVFAAQNSKDGLTLWDTRTWQEKQGATVGKSTDLCLAFSPDGRFLAIGRIHIWPIHVDPVSLEQEGPIDLWDLSINPLEAPQGGMMWHGEGQGVLGLSFSADGKILASIARFSRDVKLWDVARRRNVRTFTPGSSGMLWNVEFSPVGRILAVRGEWQTVELWDVDELLKIAPDQ
ncbi:MAG TPA: WD40 repeat domain-containing protein [Thermoguttaceae bacterium]|nr:WD40 repeat domain-containing protein [Thermoguttaceae bacterium]